jgi:protein associated with RNAse G/E
MSDNDIYKNYLHDLIILMKEEAIAAKQERDIHVTEEDGYYIGQLMAWHNVISLLQQQAISFGLSFDDLGLHDIVPERDLL